MNNSKPLTRLLRLISCLNPAEKNNFRRAIQHLGTDKTDDPIYILLFDCINDSWVETLREVKKGHIRLPRKTDIQLKPDQESLKTEAIYFDKFTARLRLRQLDKIKNIDKKANYLADKIHESIRSNQDEANLRRDLSLLLVDIHILFNKDLFHNCLELVKKAQKLAEIAGDLPALLELYRIERRLIANIKGLNSTQELRDIHKNEQQTLQKLALVTTFFDLFQETYTLLQGKSNLDTEPEIKGKINDHLEYLIDEEKIKNEIFEIQFYHHATIANLLQLPGTSEFTAFLKKTGPFAIQYQFEKIIELYDKFPIQKTEDPNKYLLNVINYLSYSYTVGKFEDINRFEDILARLDPNDPDYLRHMVFVLLIKKIAEKEFASAQAFLQEKNVWDLIQKFGKDIPASRRQVICYNAGTVYFVRGDFTMALKWYEINHLDTEPKGFRVVLTINEFFYILSRYELGKTNIHTRKRDLLTNLEKLLGKEQIKNSGFESFLFESLLSILEINKPDALKKYATNALLEGNALLIQHSSLGHFSLFLAWLESKAEERSLRSVVHKYM